MSKFYLLGFIFLVSQISIAQDFKFGKVSEEEVLEKQHPLEKEANAAVLYKYRRTYYDYSPNIGFQLISEYHERVKIYNKDGFDWATKEIKTYVGNNDEESVSGVKAYTYNIVDGKLEKEKLDRDDVIKEETNKFYNTTKFTMPAVKEGSVIEYEYKVVSPYVISIDDFELQYTIPINKLEINLSIPEYLVFRRHFNARSPLRFDMKESSKGFRRNGLDFLLNTYEVQKSNIPALIEEPYVDHIQNYAAYVKWELQFTRFPNSVMENYSTTWEGVAKSIYKDIGLAEDVNRTGYFDDEIDDLLAGVTGPIQKATKIFEYVKAKVKWDSYSGLAPDKGPRKAFQEGVGNVADINLLLTAMLKYAGLKANPVLLSTPNNGIPLYPTRNGFNYIISSFELNDQVILLDATDPTAAMGELPKRARNWQGRIVREDGTSDWVKLFPMNHSGYVTRINLQLKNNQLDGVYLKTLTGFHAKQYRDEFFEKSEDEFNEAITEKMGDIQIDGLEVENLQEVGLEIKENYNFHTNYGMELIGDKLYIKPMLFEATRENPFKAETRQYPVFFDFLSLEHSIINMVIPDDYTLVSSPESQTFQMPDNAGTFKFSVLKNGKFLRIESAVVWNKPIFTSAEYEGLKKFYDKIVEKQNETIVLGKITEDGSNELTESGR